MAARYDFGGDDDDNSILIDHNEFCSICEAHATDDCPSVPSYNPTGCSVVEYVLKMFSFYSVRILISLSSGSQFKNTLYVQFNLFRWAYGYGVRVAQGGAQIYKNIFSDFQRGGFILTEVYFFLELTFLTCHR